MTRKHSGASWKSRDHPWYKILSGIVERVDIIRKESSRLISDAQNEGDLLDVKGRFLGRKGELSSLMKQISTLSPEEKREAGKAANEAKKSLEALYQKKFKEIKQNERMKEETSSFVDVTLPSALLPHGSVHPLSKTLFEIIDAFSRLGFTIFTGPDIESDYYNFEALNIPPDHPARDMQDTFYMENLSGNMLLRTHTSPIQIRVMEKFPPPVRVIAPGTVYRCDSDITHSPMFRQVEGFAVDTKITFADLKGLLSEFCSHIFGGDVKLRFRPSFFPFTEPSAEVDISCVMCGGKGCRVCSQTGWMEILGSGMIDPEVFRFVGYDQEKYSGFAFGVGVERVAMLKYGINDIRLFFENDVRFLSQF